MPALKFCGVACGIDIGVIHVELKSAVPKRLLAAVTLMLLWEFVSPRGSVGSSAGLPGTAETLSAVSVVSASRWRETTFPSEPLRDVMIRHVHDERCRR